VGRTEGRDADDFDIEDVAMPGVEIGRPGRSGRRSPNHRLRRASLAVAAIVILAGAFAAGGLVGDPGPTSPPNQPPTEAACRTIGATSPSPAFRLAAAPDDAIGVRGLPGNPSPSLGDTGRLWQIPGPELSLTVATHGDLRLILATGVCAAEVEIEAAPAAARDEPDDRWALLRTTLAPARDEFTFDVPVDDDWVLRIVVRYWAPTGQPERLVEGYFRVRVGPVPFATPADAPAGPVATPALPCGPTPPVPADVVVTLTTGVGDPIAGVGPGDNLPLAVVGLGESLEIVVAGAACATSWTIDARVGDSIVSIEGVPNVANNPARAAQNVWRFELPGGVEEADLVVVLRFGFVGIAERLWHVTTAPFEVPAAFIVTADGRRAEAYVGCGLSVELANGYSAADSCGSIGYDGGGERFDVEAFAALAVEVPGWTIVTWSGQCGQVSAGDGPEVFESAGCELGGFAVDDVASAPPVRFVLGPGDVILQLQLSATQYGDRFGAPYYLPVAAR